MNAELQLSPALIAARTADALVSNCLETGQSFLLEAGAGAGKTYSLVETLRFLIRTHGRRLRSQGQRVACITYTNAATEVINERIDDDPLVLTATIHAFFWSVISNFQSTLRVLVAAMPEFQEKLAAVGGIGTRSIEYDLGHRRVQEDKVSLHHDDVISLAAALLPNAKFQHLLASKFPFVLVDEYQDTNSAAMEAIKAHLVVRPDGPLIGLFGDHWQRIYEKTCGHVAHPRLVEIGKRANFRSATSIVRVLNNVRPELPQAVKDEEFVGSATVYHSNDWVGTRRTGAGGGHWKGDLPADVAHNYLASLREHLEGEGWDFSPSRTKVLMLTHGVLASEQGYSTLAKVFPYTDSYIKKEDDYIAFLIDNFEPACEAFLQGRFGEMFQALGAVAPRVRTHAEKVRIAADMQALINVRATGSVGDVITLIRAQGNFDLPDGLVRRDIDAQEWQAQEGEEMPERVAIARSLRAVPYREVQCLMAYINGHTPFATKHSVKGDEFENVLVVLGRGWNKYNFEQFLEWAGSGNVPADKLEFYERNRNLFYVACSRPTTRLALLFTQYLSAPALETLQSWFGPGQVHSFQA